MATPQQVGTLCRESSGLFQDFMEVVGSENYPTLFVFVHIQILLGKKTGCRVSRRGGWLFLLNQSLSDEVSHPHENSLVNRDYYHKNSMLTYMKLVEQDKIESSILYPL